MTFVLFFVSMIVLCIEDRETCMEDGDLRGRRDTHGKEPISVAMNGRMGERP